MKAQERCTQVPLTPAEPRRTIAAGSVTRRPTISDTHVVLAVVLGVFTVLFLAGLLLLPNTDDEAAALDRLFSSPTAQGIALGLVLGLVGAGLSCVLSSEVKRWQRTRMALAAWLMALAAAALFTLAVAVAIVAVG